MKARLILEDGTVFEGISFGAEGQKIGEVVFNTSMTGYQEILTDPSYCGQIITMTYPLIGNYGFNQDDYESVRPFAHGLIVREYAEYASNWRNKRSISDWCKEYGIIGLAGIDTRMLTRKLRLYGTMRGLITTGSESSEELLEVLKHTPQFHDQVAQVSVKSVQLIPNSGKRVVLIDYGAKSNIVRELLERRCEVIRVPFDTTAEQILRFRPDGVLLSNGPGDPKDVPGAIETIQNLLGRVPIFGICLGHQLLALACGADTEKLKFGHRGGNHPVKELATGRTVLTSQNHGYAVREDSLQGTALRISHIALNDGTVEGLEHAEVPAFSVQFHPEAAPGPRDSSDLFDRFIQLMEIHSGKGEKSYA